ncbi:MAG: MFS transporter, partial [Alphaproteobacteria bacterium]|nr:MFS transporter [Alphaproteobacteria bacterium]
MSEIPDGLPRPRRDWAIATLALAITMAVMDGAIANVALPTIARDLHTNASDSIWIVNGYQLAIAISLLPLAALGEIITYRRIYIAGLALFTLSSLVCALSQSFWMLAAARILQGFGAAGIMSVNTALVRFIWPHAELGRGIGVNALVVAIAAALGPSVAAAILSVATWPYLFAVNIPLGLAALAIAGRTLPDSPRAPQRFDGRSAAMSAAMIALFIISVDALGHGEAGWIFAAEVCGTVLFAIVLVRRQLTLASPLLPVDLLAQPIIGLSAVTSILSFTAQMLALVALPFLLQTRLGFSAVATGLLITPWSVATGFAAPLAGR